MKAITFQSDLGHLVPSVRDQIADQQRPLMPTLKQASVVLAVFALGAMFHVMKWAGMLVL